MHQNKPVPLNSPANDAIGVDQWDMLLDALLAELAQPVPSYQRRKFPTEIPPTGRDQPTSH